MRTGDLAVVRASDDYAVGDVVAFQVRRDDGSQGATVIHRIVGGDAATGLCTQGDNNDFVDPWRPRPEDVTGKLLFQAPGAGAVVSTLAQPLTAAAAFAALTAFLIIAGARDERPEAKPESRDRQDSEVLS